MAMNPSKVVDAQRTSAQAPSSVTLEEDVIAARAWRDTFAALYRSRVRCDADHAHAVARLVQPSLGTLDALVAVQTVLHEPQLTKALQAKASDEAIDEDEPGGPD
jgi:hypothetical protein